ncbi:MAG TPA: methyltransferase domain-containing protein [Actinomycetaceae bacterium]|nr:methyltransferase domain-containing protein [Actinomycetaceae bacterium]
MSRDPFEQIAATWEEDSAPGRHKYERAVGLLDVRSGHRVLDVGCGTGQALPSLVAAAGDHGEVIGLEPSPAMRAEAVRLGRHVTATIIEGRAESVPLPDSWADRVLAAALLPHLADVPSALSEFARLLRPGGKLLVFHPISREQLAIRHEGMGTDDLVVAPARLVPLLDEAGFDIDLIDDAEDRFATLATRRTWMRTGGSPVERGKLH